MTSDLQKLIAEATARFEDHQAARIRALENEVARLREVIRIRGGLLAKGTAGRGRPEVVGRQLLAALEEAN